MIGQTIDNRYQIEAAVGRGGMGAVYRATDLVESRPVALKMLHAYLDSETDVALTRFQREFRVLAQLDHPHIVRAFDHGLHENVPYLTLEFLSGQTLKAALTNGPLTRDRLLITARQLSEALIYLHRRSIVHRDLKPGNLMILNGDAKQPSPGLHVKLMDFGLVRLAGFSMQLTQEGTALGTVAYMAPEQAQGFTVDFRADLYALGAVLYEMATGRPPFVHENPAVVLMQQLTAAPSPPRQLNPDLDEPLEQLILQLLSREPADRPATEQVAATLAHLADETAPAPQPASNRVDQIPRVPLIGREPALNNLRQCWLQAQAGQGQVIMLSGVAGAGKTRLLAAFRPQVQLGDHRILRGECREYRLLPYQPLLDMLKKLLDKLPASVRQELPVELARLLPDSTDYPDEDYIDQAEARLRIFAGYWRVLQQAAEMQPILMVVEDIQWAEPTTLELIGYLAERVGRAKILFVVTYRPEEVEASTPLQTMQQDLRRHQQARFIALELLNRQHVAEFLRAATRQAQVGEWVVTEFYRATGGNPFFIEETLKALAAEGEVSQWLDRPSSQTTDTPIVSLQLPQNVLALAERRLQMLSAEDRSTLTAAAVLGSEFSFAVLQALTKLDEDDLLDAIDRLLTARLIRELPVQDGEDRYRFTQEALRQALLNTISQRRRRTLHKRSGEAIQTECDTRQPRFWPILAYHFAQAGDFGRAIKYCTLAGDAASKVYASAEAIMHYRYSLDFFKEAGQPEPADEAQLSYLYASLGRNLELTGQYEEALQVYEEMIEIAQLRDSLNLKLTALLALATIRATSTSVNEPRQAEKLSRDALDLARKLNDRQAEAKALWNLLLVHKNTERPGQAVVYGEQSLAIARELNLREQIAFTLNDIAWAYWGAGQTDKTQASLAEARQLWRELNNLPMLADNLLSAAGNYYLCGDYERSLALATEGYEVSESIGNFWNQANSLWSMSHIYLDYGKFDQAIKALEESIRLSDEAGWAYGQIAGRADLGLTYGLLGAAERGLPFAQAAKAKADELYPDGRSYALGVMAQLHLFSGNIEAAELALRDSYIDLDLENSRSVAVIWVLLADACLKLAQQDYEQAATVADQLVTQLDRLQIQAFQADGLCLKGQALLRQGRLEEASRTLVEARQKAEALGARLPQIQILSALSRLESQRGRMTAAQGLNRKAQELVSSIANHIPTDLRASFMASPAVQFVQSLR